MSYYAIVPSDWRGDGIITQQFLASQFCPAEELIARERIPAVKIGVHVRNDDDAIGRLAADHFIDRGFRQFAWAGFEDCPSAREHSFRETLAGRGLDCLTLRIDQHVASWPRRQQQWIEFLLAAPQPLAVFAILDEVAAEIITAACAAGLRVPDDVAVLGVHNDDLICESLPVGLSSVDNDLEAVGYRAAAMIHSLLADGTPLPDSPVKIPPLGVVPRRSTDSLAVGHPEVFRALNFIRKHFHEPIDLAAIVGATSMSERGLYKAFRQVLGRTIHEQVIRERLALAKRLLCETHHTIEAVAVDAGFGDARTMFMHFKRETGASPSEWRKSRRPAVR